MKKGGKLLTNTLHSSHRYFKKKRLLKWSEVIRKIVWTFYYQVKQKRVIIIKTCVKRNFYKLIKDLKKLSQEQYSYKN